MPLMFFAFAAFVFTGNPHNPSPKERLFTTDAAPVYACGIRIK